MEERTWILLILWANLLLQNAVLHNHKLAYSTKKCTSVLIHENTDCIFVDEFTHFL